MALQCSGCLQKIENREYLSCCLCKNILDLYCANVSIQRFLNTMTVEHKKKWKCPKCLSKEPKMDNTNTPLRPPSQIREENESDVSNITIRKKTCHNDESLLSQDETSFAGDTINMNCATSTQIPPSDVIRQLETILDKKFECNKQSLLAELKTVILSELRNNISGLDKEIKENSRKISDVQKNTERRIEILTSEIDHLKTENRNLQRRLKEFESNTSSFRDTSSDETTHSSPYKCDHSKKIVIYGMVEYQRETEYELQDRILYAFQDILNVNLTGYLEDIQRLGRTGNRRPIMIEILSKNMTKYLLNNKYLFKNTGLMISEYLDRKSLQTKKKSKRSSIKGEASRISYDNKKQYTLYRRRCIQT